jgi:hypothetical protein
MPVREPQHHVDGGCRTAGLGMATQFVLGTRDDEPNTGILYVLIGGSPGETPPRASPSGSDLILLLKRATAW